MRSSLRALALCCAYLALACLVPALRALAAVPAGCVQVIGTNLQDSTGALVSNATLVFSPVNATGTAISFRSQCTASGQTVSTPVQATVTGGSFSLLLPDTSLTLPVNVCFSVTAVSGVDGSNLLGPGYTCLQPASSNYWCTASVCDLDLYTPNLGALAVSVPGIQGPVGPAGPTGANGPNILTTLTPTPISGVLKGAAGYVDQAVSGTDYDAPGAAAAAQAASLQKTANLSDIGSVMTARSNLGLGSAATQSSSSFDPAGAAATAQANAVAAAPVASSSPPNMDGAAAAGSSAAYSRGDHVHPTDTSRAAANGVIIPTVVPPWTQWLGDGSGGACNYTSGTYGAIGEFDCTTLNISAGATVYSNAVYGNLVFRVQGACTISGTVSGSVNNLSNGGWGNSNYLTMMGACGGGGGGGTGAGALGINGATCNGGTAGPAGGASPGGNALYFSLGASYSRSFWSVGPTGTWGTGNGATWGGTWGGQGGSSGPPGGHSGTGIIFTCGSINGTGGVIDVSGGPGAPPTANNMGASGGGGAGWVVLVSQATGSVWPTVYAAGGPGALTTVPQVLGLGGSCTSPPKATLTVSAGSFTGACAVAQAGAGCGTGAAMKWAIQGGGGTQTTSVFTPTWAGGAMASCTITAGDSAGYTQVTYTGASNGGDGGYSTAKTVQGW